MKHFSPLHVLKRSWLPRLLALAGFLTFGLQLFLYARTQTTFVDEGTYLYLGYRFVTGSLSYGELGVWNYYAPLSYFIPGLAQFLFGPGLATGRYFSIACALLAASAIWILARRLRGEWWAAAALWALALTPLQIKMYTLGLSQALTACLLSWTFVLVIGEKRSTAQILAGGLLAGLTVMTRHNLAFLLPALVGYLFWQHGRRAALLALAASLLPVLTGLALFWPSSLRLWTLYWLSQQWFPALSRFDPPLLTQVNLSLASRFSAFFLALRAHFLVLSGVVACLFLWPPQWEKTSHKKTAIFLAVFFSATLLLHTLILFSQHLGIFGFVPYVAFFSPAGLLLIILTLPAWDRRPNPARSISILLFLLLLALAPAYLDKIGDRLLALPVPRISNGIHLGEWSFLGSYLNHWFDLDYTVLRQVVPPIFFLSAGLLWLLILAGLYTLLKRHNKGFPLSFAPFTLQ
ncbi:MAG: glycosyltransferase family 39 protein, partial [Anaerolineales bacterium]|nr:glycosyltransferase family 39 protein [Anaerolineales bacterium]